MTFARLAVHRDVEEVRRHRRVVVPDVVVHHLEMPLALAGLHVDRDEAVAKQVVARAMAAVLVHQRHADRDVDEAQLGIRRVRRPRIVLADALGPDLRAVLSTSRRRTRRAAGTRLNFHSCLPGADVEAADVARDVAEANRIVAVDRRVADDDHVVHDDGRRAVGDLAERGIDADRAVGAGLRHRVPRLARPRLPRRRRVADDERARVVHGQRHEGKSKPVHQIDHAVLAELRIGQRRSSRRATPGGSPA